MKYIIDRFEKEYAICENENKKLVDIPRTKLPDQVQECDCVIETNGFYEIDKEEGRKRKEILQSKLFDLFLK